MTSWFYGWCVCAREDARIHNSIRSEKTPGYIRKRAHTFDEQNWFFFIYPGANLVRHLFCCIVTAAARGPPMTEILTADLLKNSSQVSSSCYTAKMHFPSIYNVKPLSPILSSKNDQVETNESADFFQLCHNFIVRQVYYCNVESPPNWNLLYTTRFSC